MPNPITVADPPRLKMASAPVERCNYAKESPGWQVKAGDENGTHIAEFVTPTGAKYKSAAPPLPDVSDIAASETDETEAA